MEKCTVSRNISSLFNVYKNIHFWCVPCVSYNPKFLLTFFLYAAKVYVVILKTLERLLSCLQTSKRETLLKQKTFALNFYHHVHKQIFTIFWVFIRWYGFLIFNSIFFFLYFMVSMCFKFNICTSSPVEFHNALTYIKIQKKWSIENVENT